MSTRCNLIIDSCCDLPPELLYQDGLTVLKFPYIVDGADFEDDFFQTIDAHEFYEAMRKGAAPSTSQLSMLQLTEVFSDAVSSGIPSVYISLASALSGSFDIACLVRDQVLEKNPGSELYLVDSQLASIAEGLLVYEAINQWNKGLTAQELSLWAQEARYFVDSIFIVDDLSALKRGGRMPSSIAYVGTKLDVKPLLTFNNNGKLVMSGAARGRKKGIKQMVDYFEKRVPAVVPGQAIIIADADCKKDAAKLKDLIQKDNNAVPIIESNVGPVIGSHVGPDMLAMVFWGLDRREGSSVGDKIAKRIKKG